MNSEDNNKKMGDDPQSAGRQENMRRATVGSETAFKSRKSAVLFHNAEYSIEANEATEASEVSSFIARRRVSFGDLPTNPTFKSSLEFSKHMANIIPASIKENEIAENMAENSGDDLKIMTDDGSAITVLEFDPEKLKDYDEHLSSLLKSMDKTNSNFFIVNLGMLGQHTIYDMKFTLTNSRVLIESDWNESDAQALQSKVEFVNYTESGTKFTKGIQIELNKMVHDIEIQGHHFDLKVTTSGVSHINEPFILRNANDHSIRAIIIFKATALGKNHGTAMLKLGIHKVGHTTEYMDSDFKTEWQGYIDPKAE